ncbi:hypothetical protein AAF712_007484 [Marasmius tenuissimus]|uniref:Sld7 C-terminal domain-containing protein n=1 Tax=Marasmius tenuissimus TaxID=585030 RepID=A0ABR2ZVY5_9AGAR|nr:hypothetical protein PM082_001840 [Marasmius tenuissimus]
MNSPSKGPHRLLYRGALSLPDSHLLLDGITFSARLDAEHKLLDNPLALALESMRRRPALRFLGTANLKEVYMDASGQISMDIHPDAMLSRIYFETMFCLPCTSTEQLGVRVALGDTTGPETTEIVIYIRESPSEANANQAELAVARILPVPPARLSRPDDPTPRKPPTHPMGRSRELRRLPSSNLSSSTRPGIPPSTLAASLGSDVRVGKAQPEFKVPLLPAKVKPKSSKEKGKAKAPETSDDVFGSATTTGSKSVKRKRSTENESQVKAAETETPIERENKNVIKRATVHQLAAASITKAHPEWKELFNNIYRGTGYALRSEMKTRPVGQETIDRLVAMHVGMYAEGHTGGRSEESPAAIERRDD